MAKNSLLSLLSQVTGATPGIVSGDIGAYRRPQGLNDGDEITVPGAMERPAEQGGTPVYSGLEVDRVEPSKLATDELIPRKGMFGLKGTMRDILGLVGDAFLVQGGNKPIYAPQRRQEKIGSAMYGIDQSDPKSVQAGIDRLAAQGFPEEAAKLQEQFATNQLRQAQIQSADSARQSQSGARRDKSIMDARNYASRLLSAAGNDPARLAAAMGQITKVAAALELDPEKDLGIGGQMSPEERAVYGSADMTVRQQQEIPFKERSAAVAEQNAASNALRASRPPAGRAPPQRTYANVEAEAFDTPADQRTPDQQAIVRARTEGRGGRGGVASRAASAVRGGPPKVNTQQHPVGSTVNYANGRSGVVQKDGSVKLNK